MFKHEKAKKTAFKWELLEKFNINIDEDSSETHPEKICPPVNNFSIVTVNWAIKLKFLYQEQLSGGQAIWTAIANAHQGKKGHLAKKKKKSPLRAVS